MVAVGVLAPTSSFATPLTGEMTPVAPLPPPTDGWVFSSEAHSSRLRTPTKVG